MAMSAFVMHLAFQFPNKKIGRNRFYRHVRYFVDGIEVIRIHYADLCAGVQEIDWIKDRCREAEENFSARLAENLLKTI